MAGAGLHFAGDAEHAGMFEAIGGLEIIEGFMEDEIGLALHTRQARLDALIESCQALAERLHIGLVTRGVGWVGGAQVGGHAHGDHPRIGRQQPEVGIQAAGAVGMVVFGISIDAVVSLFVMPMLVMVVVPCFVSMLFAEMA